MSVVWSRSMSCVVFSCPGLFVNCLLSSLLHCLSCFLQIVSPATKEVRPFVVAAILRDVVFTSTNYNSFLDLQDKLHQNVCRKRTLVAIGTHDLDTIQGPFKYEALPRKDIKFVPLMEEKEFDAEELFAYYKVKPSCKLKPFLYITESSPVHPVIYDNTGKVLSLPPIINGEHSKITLNTKNVLIECTATDYTKAVIVLNMVVSAFSTYCAKKYSVEAVEVVYTGENNRVDLTPHMEARQSRAGVDYINKGIGIRIAPEQMCTLLKKMELQSVHEPETNSLLVTIPCTRPDVLHPIDILEDVAIGYGYNNIVKTVPKTTTIGRQQPINKLSDLIRECVAQAGYTEVLTWALCSNDENSTFLRRPDVDTVKVANPKTVEFQVVRSSLLSGVLKTLTSNKGAVSMPVRLFELSDVVRLDPARDVGAANKRQMCALYSGLTSGFEEIHALLDRVMEQNGYSLLDPAVPAKRTYTVKNTEVCSSLVCPFLAESCLFFAKCLIVYVFALVISSFSPCVLLFFFFACSFS